MNETQLKACPFCGKQPVAFPSGDGTGEMIECTTPGCVNPHLSYYGRNVARQKWNARAGEQQPEANPNAEAIASSSVARGSAESELWREYLQSCGHSGYDGLCKCYRCQSVRDRFQKWKEKRGRMQPNNVLGDSLAKTKGANALE